VTTDGKLALIDFGLCAKVPLPDTKIMTLAIVHMMQAIIITFKKKFLQSFTDLGKLNFPMVVRF